MDSINLPAAGEPVLVSACLLGRACRYDGKNKLNHSLIQLLADRVAVAFCPEESGGLGTPRPRAEIASGDGADVMAGSARVCDENGRDVTEQFLRGAQLAVEAAGEAGIRRAYLKGRSPSCGCGCIMRDGTEIEGDGVTTAALKAAGVTVQTVE